MSIAYATVALTWDGLGSPGTNTWALRSTGSDFQSAEEFQGLMDIIRDFYVGVSDYLRSGMSVTWDGVVHGLGTDEGDSKSFDPWAPVVAGNNGNDAAEALCIVAGWRSNSGGRSGKGRTFIGPLATQAFDGNGLLAAATVATVQDRAEDLVDASTGFTNGAIGVYSRKDDVLRDFTSVLVSSKYGVLRSRRD